MTHPQTRLEWMMTQIDMPIEEAERLENVATSAPRTTVSISRAACLDEIRQAAPSRSAFPLPPILRTPGRFCGPSSTVGSGASARDAGSRPALRRLSTDLPMTEIDAADATAIFWLLSSMVSRPVGAEPDGADPSRPRCRPDAAASQTTPISPALRRRISALPWPLRSEMSNAKIAIMIGFYVPQGSADGRRG